MRQWPAVPNAPGDVDGQRPPQTIEEVTQAAIAIIVVTTTCMAIFIGRVLHRNHEAVMPPEWWTVCGLVIGFYFGTARSGRRRN